VVTAEQEQLLKQLPPDQRDRILDKMNKASDLNDELEEKFKNPEVLTKRPELDEPLEDIPQCEECIFGYNFFRYAPTTYALATNVSVPQDYVLGPGDKIEVSLYGNQTESFSSYITREGILNIPLLGPVNLLGLTFQNASSMLQEKVKSELIGTEIFITLEELRSISVYVLGEAYKPGKYTVSGLATLSNALINSGGVNRQGSLRTIQIKRNNEVVTEFDFYDFLLKGSAESDIRLLDGDVIFIPLIENKVRLGGSFRRPDLYEIIPGETFKDAMRLAGGLKTNVNRSSKIEVSRIDRSLYERELFYVDMRSDEMMQELVDGDSINVFSTAGLDIKTIELTGEVFYPGEYSIKEDDTLLNIINRAGGFTENSYTEGAVFLRKSTAKSQKDAFIRSADELEKTLVNIISSGTIQNITAFSLAPISELITRLRESEPLGRQVVDVDLMTLKTDPYANFRLQDGDKLHIPKRPYSISVVGEVLNSSTLRYKPGNSISEYISLAGGLSEQADQDKIFVIYPNGQAKILQNGLFSRRSSQLLPGSTIVVARDDRPWDAIKLTEVITPILADLATSAAAIAAISDN
tara:strand:- start:301 stop:2040 length:1740 start_codon:yes stop_codon:yes gene_type:complete